MPFIARLKGLTKLQKVAAVWPQRVRGELNSGMREAAEIVKRESQIALTTGRTRALRTGRLRASVSILSVSGTRARIAPTVQYAFAVHEGLGTSRRKGRRPYMEEGVRRALPTIENIFKKRIQTAIDVE